jgi:hypothetical protein
VEDGRLWAESVIRNEYQPILFTDLDCSSLGVEQIQTKCVGIPHTRRFVLMADYISEKLPRQEVWCTDVSDVVMLNPPCVDPGVVYVGSEEKPYDHWRWMCSRSRGCPFWSQVRRPAISWNCGIVGGLGVSDFTSFLGLLNNVCKGLNDMHALYYAIQRRPEKFVTGWPVHNVFGSDVGSDEWFKHK